MDHAGDKVAIPDDDICLFGPQINADDADQKNLLFFV
jgi:hypothetical protein